MCVCVWSVCVCLGLIPTVSEAEVSSHKCLMVSRVDGTCRSFSAADQSSFVGCSVCLDPVYDNLWRSVFSSLSVSLSLSLCVCVTV